MTLASDIDALVRHRAQEAAPKPPIREYLYITTNPSGDIELETRDRIPNEAEFRQIEKGFLKVVIWAMNDSGFVECLPNGWQPVPPGKE